MSERRDGSGDVVLWYLVCNCRGNLEVVLMVLEVVIVLWENRVVLGVLVYILFF